MGLLLLTLGTRKLLPYAIYPNLWQLLAIQRFPVPLLIIKPSKSSGRRYRTRRQFYFIFLKFWQSIFHHHRNIFRKNVLSPFSQLVKSFTFKEYEKSQQLTLFYNDNMRPLFCFLSIITPSIALQVNPSFCHSYYSIANLPQQCTGSACIFPEGLFSLINDQTNETETEIFKLCLDLPSYSFTIFLGSNITRDPIPSLYMSAHAIAMESYFLEAIGSVVVETAMMIDLSFTTLTGSKLWLYSSGNIKIYKSQIFNESVIETECTCTTTKNNCDWNFTYPQLFDSNDNNTFNLDPLINSFNYSISPPNSATIISNYSIALSETSLHYSIIGLFSKIINMDGCEISSTGLGYPSNSGPGCGYYNDLLGELLGCMGSGGSHGGFGGSSSPRNCYLMASEPPYGNLNNPKDPGSGGGFFINSQRESAGGGVINIQTIIMNLSGSTISANGMNGIMNGGGGSGGSISIDYSMAEGRTVIPITANGGSGDKKSSSGSGGRIRFWNHSWNQSYPPFAQGLQKILPRTFVIKAKGGTGCEEEWLSCGEEGSITAAPCQPGYELSMSSFSCEPCSSGTFQMTYGYSFCLSCPELPEHASWDETIPHKCQYSCDEHYSYSSYSCLSLQQYLFHEYQLLNVLISFGMIVVAAIIYGTIRFIQFLRLQYLHRALQGKMTVEHDRKMKFCLEDLPYHQLCIYLSGNNTPTNPWIITEAAQQQYYKEVQNREPLPKINSLISQLFSTIRSKAKFSTTQKLILICLKYLYYPFKILILNSIRNRKIRKIFQQVDDINTKLEEEIKELKIKFHVKHYLTVACIQIFNFKKRPQDFYIQSYFPLYFMLERQALGGGHSLDLSDLFLRSFIDHVPQRDKIEEFLKETHKLLKNSKKTTTCLSNLWKLCKLNPCIHACLFQPPHRLLGHNHDYKVSKEQPLFLVITSSTQSNRHFFHLQILQQIAIPESQQLKSEIEITEYLTTHHDGITLWLLENSFSEKVLLLSLAILTALLFLVAIANLILVSLALFDSVPSEMKLPKLAVLMLYSLFWPFCELAVCLFNFRAILGKSELLLSNAIIFNFFSIFKSVVIQALAIIVSLQNLNYLVWSQYIWLIIVVIGFIMFFIHTMLRTRISVVTK